MNKVEIFEIGQTVEVPSSWNEMTSEQIQFVFKTFDYCVKHKKSPLEFNIRVLYYLLGIRPSPFKVITLSEMFAENVYRLCDSLLEFMFKDSEQTANLSFDSIENPLPYIKIGFKKYSGLSSLLVNMTFGNFRRAATALNTFFISKDENDLNECIAYLYKLPSPRKASRLPSWQKNLIMLWFSACIQYLQTGIVEIDGEKVNMSLLFGDDEKENSSYGYNWNDILIEIAKEQTIGPIDRVDEEPLFSIFALMWHNYKERKHYEKINKS